MPLLLLFIWFIIAFVYDGNSYKNLRNKYDKHFEETTMPVDHHHAKDEKKPVEEEKGGKQWSPAVHIWKLLLEPKPSYPLTNGCDGFFQYKPRTFFWYGWKIAVNSKKVRDTKDNVQIVNRKALYAVMLAALLPLICYFIVKRYSESAVVMPI